MRNEFRRASPLAILISMALIAFGGFRANAAGKNQAPEAIPGEYVIKFRSQPGRVRTMQAVQAQKRAAQRALRRLGASSVDTLRSDDRFAVVKMNQSGIRSASVIGALSQSPEIEYVEPNYIYRTIGDVPENSIASAVSAVKGAVAPRGPSARSGWGSDDDWFGGWNPGGGWGGGNNGGQEPGWGGDWGWGGGRSQVRLPNDPSFAMLWGMNNTGQADSSGQAGTAGIDIGAPAAWAYGVGSRNIVVAVIDTGIDYNHPDLAANMWINSGEVAGNGIDDDGNGFVDDVRGWNFHGHHNDPMDDNRHGTHCAGTIGALGDNGVGVAGVSWQVTLMPLKFLSADGSGSLAGALEAVRYATKMRVHVMSNSWGGGGFSQALMDAITEARDRGILFVAAAGNESNNNDARPTYPATYQVENVVSVAAMDNQAQVARWSNYGARTVHLAAPGVRIYSTTPNNGYESLSGTSMACPHVAGAAALLWSQNTEMTYADIKARLLATTQPSRTLSRKTMTGGYLNLYNALTGRVPERPADPREEDWSQSPYTIESSHNYADNADQTFSVQVPGARFVRVRFSRVAMEEGYDFLRILDNAGQEAEVITGRHAGYVSTYVEGDTLFIQMKSDATVNDWGFAVDRVDFIM